MDTVPGFPANTNFVIPSSGTGNNNSHINYLYREQQIVDKEFGAVDHLVMTAFLIISLGLSLNKTLSYRSDIENIPEKKTQKRDPETPVSCSDIIFRVVITGGSTTSPFVNTLCLFGITGEVFKNDGRVVYFLLGMLLSIGVLFITKYFTIMAENGIVSFPSYLRKRFHRRGISFIVAFSSILRHFVGGALNLCVMGIGTSAMTGLSPLLSSIIIAAAAVACTSASRIHSGNNSSIGGTLIWLVGITSLVTLTVTTVKEGGFIELFRKNAALGNLPFPGLTPSPWENNTLWGFLAIGMVLGFQLFAFSRSTLRLAKDLPRRPFCWAIFATLLFISIWTLIGVWAGLCVSLAFQAEENLIPDGLLPKLVSREMQDIRGFRGFFVSSLFAASISGVTRRYNQLIELMWEEFHDLCTSDEERERDFAREIQETPKNISDAYLKELRWERRKRTCCFNFFFKFCVSFLLASISLGIVYLFLSLNTNVWEIWQSIVGIFIGPLVAVMLISLYFPCISHMSVCLGLMVGWAIPCMLMIGNKVSNINDLSVTSSSPLSLNPELAAAASSDLQRSITYLNKTIHLKETVFVIMDGHEYKEVSEDENSKDPEFRAKSSQNQRRQISIDGKILSTCYCYYGPIGTIACILSSLLFAGTAGKCGTKVAPSSLEVMHPCVRDKFFCVIDKGTLTRRRAEQEPPPAPPEVTNKKKKNALKSIQETANI